MNRVSVRVGTTTPALKILPTYETAINVDVRQRHRADLLEVEIENCSVNLGKMLCRINMPDAVATHRVQV